MIQKEFSAFGHKFITRGWESGEKAPIFLQFLDCVYQLICQFPRAFEFNEKLLITLADAYHDGKYGTFLFNSHRERQEARVGNVCPSVWWHIATNPNRYTNISFTPEPSFIMPDFIDRYLRFWSGFYFRYDERRKSSWREETISARGLHQKLLDMQQKLLRLKKSDPHAGKLRPYASPPAEPSVSSASSSSSSKASKSSAHLSFKLIDELLNDVGLMIEQSSDAAQVDESMQESPPNSPRDSLIGEASGMSEMNSSKSDGKELRKSLLKANRPKWVPDSVKTCHTCQTKIGKGTRHHCRACGHIFCDPCCNKKLPIPRLGYVQAVRVCESCALRLRHEASQKHLQEIQTFRKRTTTVDPN